LPGRNPREAVAAFIDPLKDTLSCVVHAKITLSPGGWGETGSVHALTLNDDQPAKLLRQRPRRPSLMLRVGMQYQIVPTNDPERPPWRVTTRAYAYELQTMSGELVLSYHWHPDSAVKAPHTHLGRTQLAPDAVLSQKAHQPTGRVSLESIVRACITEYNARPLRDDWDKSLALREGDFQLYRSWS
jgi:hypothetical protein